MPSELITTWAGEALTLYPERAMYWPRARTLILADPHFGKAATFRAAGIPVPAGTTQADLLRLDELLHRSGAERLLVLGDFFHAAAGRAPESPAISLLGEWRRHHLELQLVVIRGNHDLHAGDPPAEWNIEVVPSALCEGPFHFCHDAGACGDVPADLIPLSGHVHPAVRLHDRTGTALRLPCFLLKPNGGLLPAFGGFTGSAIVRPAAGDQVFVIADKEIVRVS